MNIILGIWLAILCIWMFIDFHNDRQGFASVFSFFTMATFAIIFFIAPVKGKDNLSYAPDSIQPELVCNKEE